MVPERLKRLAGRSASEGADEESQAERARRLESREGSEPTGNPLPSAWVRTYVWRRDRGRCARCGGQERVWFEYVVPVRAGGSNTEQNLQPICERCSHDAGRQGGERGGDPRASLGPPSPPKPRLVPTSGTGTRPAPSLYRSRSWP
jgi:hypothetical protein